MRINDIIEVWDSVLFSVYNVFVSFHYLFNRKCKKIIKHNKTLKDKHKGERCFIVMNGPSIKQHDLSLIKNEVVFVSNYFFRSSLVDIVKPNYYVWLDSNIADTPQVCEDVFNDITSKCPDADLLLNYKLHSHLLKESSRQHFFYVKHMPNLFNVKGNLSGISSNFTSVVFFAIMSAIYMGFKDIYILGLDFEPGGFVHFEDLGEGTECEKPSSKVIKSEVCGLHWQYSRAQYESFWIASYAKKRNCNLYNLNENSHIRAFDFAQYQSLF